VIEHRVTVSRSTRYYTMGRPGREAWFVLHGYGQLAERFLTECGALDDGTRLIVAPEALSRFYVDRAHRVVGASWMTREDRRAAAARWVAAGRARAERLILWGGEVPPDVDLDNAALAARLAHLRLTLVAGRQDDYITDKILERDGERLRRAGVPFTVVRFAGGHVIDERVLREIVGG
jgi:hypothetical protein